MKALFERLRQLRHSVRARLMGMVLLVTVMVLLFAGTALLVQDLKVYRTSFAQDVSSVASSLALSTAPALAFDDHATAQLHLSSLRTRHDLLTAAAYGSDGRLFASYSAAGTGTAPASLPLTPGVRAAGERVEALQPIMHNGERLGSVYLAFHYDVRNRAIAYLRIFAVLTVFGIMLALALSYSLQSTVSEPLAEIAQVARQVVEKRDYSLRVAAGGDDEIGIVISGFNRMLDEVREQTTALTASNRSLTTEIAERQLAEDALARANVRLESTLAAAEIGSWLRQISSGELSVDRNFAAILGRPGELDAFTHADLFYPYVHKDDLGIVQQAQMEALRTGLLNSGHFRIRRPDGSLRWLMARGKLIRDAAGNPQTMAGLLIDVTAEHLADEQRRQSEKIYRAIGESIDFGVWITDAEGSCIYASDSFLKLTGLTMEQCSSLGWTGLLHPDDEEATVAAWNECVRNHSPWYREHRILGVDGQYHPVLAQGVPMLREDGSIQGWAGINLDISRLKQSEEALRQADRRKDEFLATLAHELRNPLAPIRHAAELLGIGATSEQQRQWSREVIARQVSHMALLLDDLLDISRITRGRLELRREFVRLSQIAHAAVETARPMIESRGHVLEINLPADELSLNVDPLRMSQALSNLLTNAAKYTEPGGRISLGATVGDSGLSLVVADNGIGLAPGEPARIFEMFAQSESAAAHGQGGLGIGLALVRGLVGLHGGSITATSAGPGLGSTFTLQLPPGALIMRTPSAGAAAGPLVDVGNKGYRILVADDNRDGADSLTALLVAMGHSVQTVYDGEAACKLAEEMCPQVLILDIGMPCLDGYEVTRRLRQTARGRQARFIALTGWGQKEDIDRALAAGFDQHLTKPLDIRKLQRILTQIGNDERAPSSGSLA